MNVLIDDGFALSRVGGVGRYTSYVAEALRLHACDVRATFAPHDLLSAVRPTPVRRILYSMWLNTAYIRGAQRSGANIVHFTNYATPRRRRSTIAYAVSIHDMVVFLHPDTKSNQYTKYLRGTIRRSAAAADCIFALTEAAKSEIVGVLGIRPEKVFVCSVGSTLGSSLPAADDPEPPVRVGAPYLLAVGTVERRKNIDSLVDAMPAIWDSFPELGLVIVGQAGIGSSRVLDAINRVDPNRKRIRVIAKCDDRDLARLYSESAVFVFPSLYEGLGIPLIEAMGRGVPVVATEIPSSVEVTGGAALTVAPVPAALAEGVIRVLGSTALQAVMRDRGRARAATYNYARTATELVAGYEAVVRE